MEGTHNIKLKEVVKSFLCVGNGHEKGQVKKSNKLLVSQPILGGSWEQVKEHKWQVKMDAGYLWGSTFLRDSFRFDGS